MTWQEFISAIFHPNPENLASTLIWNVRLPRFFLALIAGGVLAIAGQGIQILVRNPLADPYTMGTASGASLGINLALTGWLPGFMMSIYWVPIWGFAGALGSSFLVLAFLSGRRNPDNGRFLLIGVAVSMLANSALSLLTFVEARQNEVRYLLFWTFGNLDKATWDSVLPIGGMSAIGLLAFFAGRNAWPFLLLGDDKAESIGVPVFILKRLLMILCAFLTACVVSMAGPIGFVGLVVPYWTRKMLHITSPSFLPLTFLVGSTFLAGCDLLSRIIFLPYGLPIGLVTSLVGVPFFLYLLRETSREESF
jgi:iron complex transport system permease protein